MYVHTKFTTPQLIECGYLTILKQNKLITEENINAIYYQKRTAMHIALISNQVQIIKWLMQLKPDLTIKDSMQLTVLDWLRYKPNQNLFQFMLKTYQDKEQNQRNFVIQNMSILRASQICLQKVVEITKKQNPFIKDQFKRNALHWASISGNVNTFQYLIEQKFDPLKQDIFGFNCYDYIRINPHNQIRLLIKMKYQNESKLDNKSKSNAQVKFQENEYEVIIIGAGASGIGAALTLARKGIPYIILQARDRFGGRILSEKISEVEIDLGACWVHSYSKNNPIAKQVKKLNWKPKKSQSRCDSHMRSQISGQQLSQQILNECRYYYRQFLFMVEKNSEKSQHDLSIWDAGKQYYEKNIQELQPLQKSVIDMLINMTEHYEAANISELSSKNYEDRDDEGGDFFPECSYYKLLQAIIQSQKIDQNIKYKSAVKKINYQKDHVIAICENGQTYKGRKIVLSAPLGLLKNQFIQFIPQLPQSHSKIIKGLGFGLMNKVIISFSEPFWKGNPHWIRVASEEKGKFPAIYNFSTKDKNILCCFVTDNFAKKISKLTDEQIINEMMETLCKAYKLKNLKPIDSIITRWDQQPYSLGSYTHFDVGTCGQDAKSLRKNIENKIWMVGQHCYGEHIGTAHGAFQTGIWAAEQILTNIKFQMLN